MIKQQGDEYKRLVLEGNRLVGFVLINSSTNAGIYTSLISNKIDLSTIKTIFWIHRRCLCLTRIYAQQNLPVQKRGLEYDRSRTQKI